MILLELFAAAAAAAAIAAPGLIAFGAARAKVRAANAELDEDEDDDFAPVRAGWSPLRAVRGMFTKSPGYQPKPGAYQTTPAEVWTDWAVRMVREALLDHEQGMFAASAMLADHMRRDDRIFSTLDNLVLGALGLPYSTEPSEATPKKRLAAELARDVDAWWFDCIPESTIADLCRWVVLLGFAVAEIIWEVVDGEYRPRLHVHHPQFVRYDRTLRKWQLTTTEGVVDITPGDGRWLLFTLGSDRPWMNGAIRALAIPWLMRTFANRDWARRSEIDGIGVRIAKLPPADKQVSKEAIAAFLKSIKRLGSETTIKLPEGFGFELMATEVGAADGFDKLIARCDTAITLVLLGQNLTTQIEGGSYAAATVHAKVQLDRLEALLEGLSTTCHDQILVWWGRYNVDAEDWNDNATPWPRWDTTPPEDRSKNAQTLLTLSQALVALIAMGVDVAPVLERFGLSLVDDLDQARVPLTELALKYGLLTLNESRARLGAPEVEDGDDPPKLVDGAPAAPTAPPVEPPASAPAAPPQKEAA